MARLVHLNGPPGIGKSTLSALYADRNPGTLNLDVDTLHRLVGGSQDEESDTWPLVWSLIRAMAATHLDGGRDVVLPQYVAKVNEIIGFENLARQHGAGFREVVLLDDREAAIERFNRRAQDSDDPWIRHHHRLIELGGGPDGARTPASGGGGGAERGGGGAGDLRAAGGRLTRASLPVTRFSAIAPVRSAETFVDECLKAGEQRRAIRGMRVNSN
jgi:predicted kinase